MKITKQDLIDKEGCCQITDWLAAEQGWFEQQFGEEVLKRGKLRR